MVIRGTLICSLAVVFFDVVVGGSYVFSALVCPIWFLAAVVWAIARQPSLAVAAARILVPVVTGLLVIANFSLQGKIAMGNSARVIEACEKYREINGAYPERLSELVPDYLSSVPRAKYCFMCSEFGYYSGAPRPILFWWEFPPFGRRVYTIETGKWQFLD